MKDKTCKYCGKSIDSFGFEVEPIHDVPEMNKKSFFCSKSCFHRFVGGIKSSRKKTAKAALRTNGNNSTSMCIFNDLFNEFAKKTA